MGMVNLNESTHILLKKIVQKKSLKDKARYTNDQIVKLGLELLEGK